MSFSRKKNPSHVAQVDTPWPSSCPSEGSPSMRADAPVEMISASARYSVLPTHAPNGEADRSTRSTSAVTNSAPKRSACSPNFIMSSGPRMPYGKPGYVPTHVGRTRCPPASAASITIGLRSARAAYSAAVRPAGPDPTMTRSRTSFMERFPGSFRRRNRRPPRPAERTGDDEDSAEDQVRGPDSGRDVDVDQPEEPDRDDR